MKSYKNLHMNYYKVKFICMINQSILYIFFICSIFMYKLNISINICTYVLILKFRIIHVPLLFTYILYRIKFNFLLKYLLIFLV
ncbi:hypothetical protein PFAG_00757 [Plasmodium falciparum Santa Lucia]|uniref:Uncharacterized protein n=2 Tax=Plasmodium falciparum TaxID=5833 RepID=A0A024VCK5_PLAFA|nr:hypothetical protein PFFVO_00803 [Plasmodium falciparum Vietnam Oak-Knoll (FVO)]EUT91423.1 hypothetical protein PFAG_00757 [Plasmodium falciparum Santa Lucia]